MMSTEISFAASHCVQKDPELLPLLFPKPKASCRLILRPLKGGGDINHGPT